jgi:hypothetical protein
MAQPILSLVTRSSSGLKKLPVPMPISVPSNIISLRWELKRNPLYGGELVCTTNTLTMIPTIETFLTSSFVKVDTIVFPIEALLTEKKFRFDRYIHKFSWNEEFTSTTDVDCEVSSNFGLVIIKTYFFGEGIQIVLIGSPSFKVAMDYRPQTLAIDDGKRIWFKHKFDGFVRAEIGGQADAKETNHNGDELVGILPIGAVYLHPNFFGPMIVSSRIAPCPQFHIGPNDSILVPTPSRFVVVERSLYADMIRITKARIRSFTLDQDSPDDMFIKIEPGLNFDVYRGDKAGLFCSGDGTMALPQASHNLPVYISLRKNEGLYQMSWSTVSPESSAEWTPSE